MTNLTSVPQPPVQLSQRGRYSREQIRLYFFPYSERPIKELERELRLWMSLVAGLALLVLLLFVWLESSGQAIVNIGFLAIVCIVVVVVTQIFIKKINPVREKLDHERSELAKERNDMQMHPPPSEEDFEAWINAIGEEAYHKAPKKLQLPEQPGKYFGDLFIRAVIRPSRAKPPSPWSTEAASQWSPRLHKLHCSINIFTRLFVLEDYIAIYTDVFNARDAGRVEEKFEHCFHQHVSYVSLNVESETVKEMFGLLSQQLSITLDSGYTIKLDIASAKFSKKVRGQNGYYNIVEDTSDTSNVHKGLLEVLNDHKKSMLRSLNEHD